MPGGDGTSDRGGACHRRRRATLRRTGDTGETLIEVLVTVVLMGIAVVALLTTMMAVVTSSHGHKRRVQAENEATTIVEAIDRMAYVPCATAASYAPALATAPNPQFVPVISEIRYLANGSAANASYVAGCPGTGDQGAQQITVQVSAPGRYGVTAEVALVKRDDTCPASPPPALQIAPGDRC